MRLKFYKLMIDLHTFEKDCNALFRDWQGIYTTRGIDKREALATEALQHTAFFLCLSAHDNEQHDMLHRLSKDKRLDTVPTFK